MRFLAQILVLLVFWVAMPTAGHALCSLDPELETSDPHHPGCRGVFTISRIQPVQWIDAQSDCPACDNLVTAYNNAVRARFALSYRLARIEDERRRTRKAGQQRQLEPQRPDTRNEGLSEFERGRASANLNRAMSAAEMDQDVRPLLEAQVRTLRQTIARLDRQITECERRCEPEQTETATTTGGGALSLPSGLPFAWQGPYPPVCTQCEKLAQRLNAIPNLYYREKAGYDVASAEKVLAEAEITGLRGAGGSVPADGLRASIREQETKRDRAEAEMARHRGNMEVITQNFTDTLALYNDCIKQCGPQKSACVAPGGGKVASIRIGPNDKYGTTAAFTNKVKETAAGALGGLLGGLTGGAFSLGGGDDDKPAGPEIKSDPLSDGDFTHINGSGFDVGVRAGFVDGNFIVSQKIFESPDDNSTFHATWLVDSMGRKILPKRYIVFDIYVDHKLTVWWTYDHWTNGQHDYHDEGGWTEEWTEDLGKLRFVFEGEKGVKNSIWYQSGFDTAVKGVRSVAAVYENVDPDIFMGPCPLTTVTHLTQPSQTPILSTVPLVGNLFRGEKTDDDSPLTVLVRPRIIRDAQ